MHRFSDEEMTERASLYALGALSQWEARSFEEHLAEGCDACAAELLSFEDVTRALALGTPEAEPPARVRQQLLSLVAVEDSLSQPQHSPRDATAPQLMTLRADEGDWYEAASGIQVKQLFLDPQTRMVTTLVKMQPGTLIPLHRHQGIEQCYVIEGDFHADDQQLGAGDFHVAQPGSTHKPVYTVNGALLLIVAAEDYHVLERH